MACSKWEQVGLLYTSGELSDVDTRQYVQHLEKCSDCREEVARYQQEQEQLYSVDILGASPSPAVDAEIIRVCAAAPKPTTPFGVFGLFVGRPIAAAVLFLVLGLGTGSYVAYQAETANRMAESDKASGQQLLASDSAVAPAVASSTETDSATASDSLEKTSPFPRPASAPSKGVVPVDLENNTP